MTSTTRLADTRDRLRTENDTPLMRIQCHSLGERIPRTPLEQNAYDPPSSR